MRYLSAPAISRLTATKPPMTVHSRLSGGKYGRVLRCGRIPYAAIDAIETFHGVRFTEQQIALAVDGKPDRLLVIPDKEEN